MTLIDRRTSLTFVDDAHGRRSNDVTCPPLQGQSHDSWLESHGHAEHHVHVQIKPVVCPTQPRLNIQLPNAGRRTYSALEDIKESRLAIVRQRGRTSQGAVERRNCGSGSFQFQRGSSVFDGAEPSGVTCLVLRGWDLL
jgi:hypothetical protein